MTKKSLFKASFEESLNLEDDDFIREYRNSRFHRFREIERFALLDKKFSKYQSQADIPVRF